MQCRSGRLWTTLAPVFAAMIVAGCAKDTITGPRIAALVIISGTGQSGPLGATLAQPFKVRVEDQSGQPVPGITVNWQVTGGGGVITPSQSTTDDQGVASATLRLGVTSGTNTVNASLDGGNGIDFTATATAAGPAKLLTAGGDAQTGTVGTQLLQDLMVKVTDAVDNPKAGVIVSFAVTSGGGSLSAASAVTDATGIASVRWTLGSIASPQTAIASVSGLAPITFTATGRAGSPDALTVLTGNNQSGSPGVPLPDSLRIRLTDKFGNPISGVTIIWSPSAASGTANPASSVTDANGRTATRWTLGSTGGAKSLTVSGGGFSQTFSGGGNFLYQTMSVGSRHSCGLAQGGVAYCWGYNGDGQLGIGQPPLGSGPVFSLPQPTGTTGNLTFALLSSGRFHACALTLAGVPYCWGVNVDGRLGTGGNVSANLPTAVVADRAYNVIAAGQGHTCSLDLAGRAFCWGSNTDGQLGAAVGVTSTLPVAVQGGLLFFAISTGGLHSCAIDTLNAAWCWGNGASGQLGNGAVASSNAPVAVSGGILFSVIATGNLHSCGLNAAGVPFCWGSNASGQLGIGAGPGTSVPTAVAGGLSFTTIVAGLSHSCGLTAAGALYCWGANNKGQLGDGTITNRPLPTLVSGGLTFRTMSAGDAHSCAVTTTNVAFCWGDNEFGQLGEGTVVNRLVPTRVAFQP